MGDGGLFVSGERDHDVLARNARAGHLVLAAETAVAAARAAGAPLAADVDDRVDRAWRKLLLGEVSDATGWNPIHNEIEYALWHANAASTDAVELVAAAASALDLGLPVVVDTAAQTVSAATDAPGPELEPAPTVPLEVAVSGERTVDVRWERVRGEPEHFVLTIDFGATPGEVAVVFPWDLESVRYTPALLEGEVVEAPLADLAFTETAVAAGAGPVGLADGLWLVPEVTEVNLAARFDRSSRTISFLDQTLPPDATARWRFHVVAGPVEQALAVANALNLHPSVRVER
jgi:hypothetical protein